MKQILRDITSAQLKKREPFKVGDGVRVHTKVREGDKERIQIFSGVVIALRGTGIEEMFTVRRIASGVGVERVFPLHSPNVEKIEVDREAVTGRARMYYIRERVGKEATKVNEKRLLEAMGVTVDESPEAKAAAESKVAEKAAALEKAKAEKTKKIEADKAARAQKKAAKSEKSEAKGKDAKKVEKHDKKAEKTEKKAKAEKEKKAAKK